MQSWIALLFLLGCVAAPAADIEIPFEFIHNQIVVSAGIGSSGPYNFLLDTGTHGTTIDVALARRLHLPLETRQVPSAGAGNRAVTARRTVIDAMHLGALELRRLPADALDLAHLARQLGRPLHGALGYGFLDSRIVQVDYFHRRIRLCDASPFGATPTPQDSRNRIAFPMVLRAGSALPVLEDCLVDGVRIPVTIDTGSSLGLILFPQAIRRLGMEQLARQGIPLGAAGYRGQTRLTKGWVRSVKLKTIDLGAIEVAYVEQGYGEGETLERRGGNLGNATLQDFTLTLDYRNRVVVLEALEQ